MVIMAGFAMYRESGKRTQIVNYWLPQNYRLVDVEPTGWTGALIDPGSLRKVSIDHKVDVLPGRDHVTYFVYIKKTILASFPQRYDGYTEMGVNVVAIDTTKPGLVSITRERSWHRIVISSLVVGFMAGCMVWLLVALVLLIFYQVFKLFIGFLEGFLPPLTS